MIRALEESGSGVKSHFIFGVREQRDSFYLEELERIKSVYPLFDYHIYLSQEDSTGTIHGRVTDFLTRENTVSYEEFYLCGSPAMVGDARAKLEEL